MNSALLLIDFINDIVHPNGKLKSCADECAKKNTMDKANRAAAFARNNNMLVIHIKVGFDSNYQTHPAHSIFFKHAKENCALQLNTWGTEFHETINIQPTDSIVIKSRINALYATHLENILRANRIQHLFLAGVSTTWAIEATARDAHDKDYQVSILEDACAARTEEAHKQSISVLSSIATIIQTEEMKIHCDH